MGVGPLYISRLVHRLFAAAAVVTALGLLGLGAWLLTPLPPAQVPVATRVYDAQGRLITYIAAQRRVPVAGEDMPLALRQAVVAVEDSRFYRHWGVDPIGVVRAFVRNYQAGRTVEGASTITSQLARNSYLSLERTWDRKIREAFLSLKLEAHMTKEEILTAYLNTIYYGHGAYSAEVAARTYFGKGVAELDLAESALLAAVIRSPGLYSPYLDLQRARERRDFVLGRMVELGYITAAEAEAARAQPIRLAGLEESVPAAPYFVDYVRSLLREHLPHVEADLARGGYEIHTALDLDMQRAAEEAFARHLGSVSHRDAQGIAQPQGALVALDPRNGHIKALVGGRDFRESQFNRATDARRQPGSAFKVFVYTALVDQGIPLSATQLCEFVAFPGPTPDSLYEPTDFGDEPYHWENLTMRDALRVSDNVVTVKWAQVIGPSTIARYARRMGIMESTPLEPTLPLALGASEVTPLELTAAYAPLANGGYRVEPVAVTEVRAADGRILWQQRSELEPVLAPATAYLITDALRSVLDDPDGTGSHLRQWFQRPAAGKTGTTNERRSAWFVGYTPDLVASVYVGNDDQVPLWGGGGAVAGPIWARFMAGALADVPVKDWDMPADVFAARTCVLGGSPEAPWIRPVWEVFRQGTYPGDNCPWAIFQ